MRDFGGEMNAALILLTKNKIVIESQFVLLSETFIYHVYIYV